MLRRFTLRLVILGCSLLSISAVRAADLVLAKRHAETLTEHVVPAYKQGDPLEVLKFVSPLVGRLDDDRLRVADEILRQHDVPAVNKLLADSRRTLVEQGMGGILPKPSLRELVVVVPVLVAEVDSILDELTRHPAMADPLPKHKMPSEYEQLFWKIHVMDNRLTNARTLAEYTGQLVSQLPSRRSLVKLLPPQRAAIEADYVALAQKVIEAQQELRERSLELRLQRLIASVSVLKGFLLDEEHFMAAYSVAVDSRILKDYFHSGPQPGRGALQAPEIEEEVLWLESLGRERGGDLIAKSEMLYHGLHWWLRGRYGRGSDGFGLFKSEIALSSPEAMFRLVMPRDPTEAAALLDQGDNSYPVDRRHYYTWAWEDRVVPFRKVLGDFT